MNNPVSLYGSEEIIDPVTDQKKSDSSNVYEITENVGNYHHLDTSNELVRVFLCRHSE